MDDATFTTLEVRPNNNGRYKVTVYDYEVDRYFIDTMLYFNGWDYAGHPNSYVCFIHAKAKDGE